MPPPVQRKQPLISIRLREADIAIIDRAATRRGLSRTDFVRNAAVRAAEDVLMESVPIRMSSDGFKAFVETISGPAKPVAELKEIFKHSAPWEFEG